jgi:hypothetical protein
MRSSFACIAMGMLSLGGCARTDSNQAGTFPYVPLDDQASQLREDFNRATGSVRLLFVIDPVDPPSLQRLDDMNRDLLGGTTDPHLETFVVHEPVLGVRPFGARPRRTAAHDISVAAALLHNPHVRHYWNASGVFGRLLSESVGLKNSKRGVYAWDVWLIYGPEATWSGAGPPAPRLLMHEIYGLRDSNEFPPLDTGAFAKKVLGLLAQLPSPSAEGASARKRSP